MFLSKTFSVAAWVITESGIIAIITALALTLIASIGGLIFVICKYKKVNAALKEAGSREKEIAEQTAELEKSKAEIVSLKSELKIGQKALDETKSALSIATENAKKLHDQNSKLSSDRKKLKKANSENKKKTEELSESLNAANELLEALSEDIAKHQAERRPADRDFEIRWKNYDCLVTLYRILADAATASAQSYQENAIREALTEIKKVVK